MIPLSMLASDRPSPKEYVPKYELGQSLKAIGRGVHWFYGTVVEIEIHDDTQQANYLILTCDLGDRAQKIWLREHQVIPA